MKHHELVDYLERNGWYKLPDGRFTKVIHEVPRKVKVSNGAYSCWSMYNNKGWVFNVRIPLKRLDFGTHHGHPAIVHSGGGGRWNV